MPVTKFQAARRWKSPAARVRKPQKPAQRSRPPPKKPRTRGTSGSTLSINFVDRPGAGKGDAGASPSMPPDFDLTNPMMMNMLKTMFQGFKVNVVLDVQGTITKTNAEYVEGSRVTLLAMDMNALLADEAALKELTGKMRADASFAELKPLLKNINGIKIDGPAITVQFK